MNQSCLSCKRLFSSYPGGKYARFWCSRELWGIDTVTIISQSELNWFKLICGIGSVCPLYLGRISEAGEVISALVDVWQTHEDLR